MARIISEKDPATGQRVQVGAVEGETAYERKVNANDLKRTTGTAYTPVSTAITSDMLAPAEPMKLTQPRTPVLATGLNEYVTGLNNSAMERLKAENELKAKEAETGFKQSKSALQKFLGERLGVTARTDAAYRDEGVDTAKKELNAINSKINAVDFAYKSQIKRIQENAGGLETSGVEGEIRRVEREAAWEKAGLFIEQMAKQGDYQTAREIADRRVAMEIENDQIDLETRRLDYEDNKEMFNKVDQRDFELKLAESEREIEQKALDLRQKHEFALEVAQNGGAALVPQILNASSFEEAMTIGARYASDPLDREIKRLQMNKLQSEVNESNGLNQIGNDITSLLGSNKIGAGTKTSIGTILGVTNAVADLASKRSDGKFKGFSPFSAATDFLTPNSMKSAEATQNEQYIDAINLKVQQWASGATLTEAQTKMVNKMVPTKWDTDKKVREKLNTLTNFMNQQIKGALMAEGIAYEPPTVDLFPPKSLDDIFSGTSTTSPMTK